MTILGFVVLSLFFQLCVWGGAAVRRCRTTHQRPVSHWPVLRNLGIGIKTPKFSCLLLIFHSFGQIWWRGQFQELASFPTVFN